MTGDGTATWEWLGHFCLRLTWSGSVLYVDPFALREKIATRADLVLVTNPRPGHLSHEDLELVRGPDAVVAGPPDVVAGLRGPVRALTAGESFEFEGLSIDVQPAYTITTSFFPRDKGWLGFLFRLGDQRIFHAGATEVVPEHAELRADVALLPVSGRYVMGPEDARALAGRLGASALVGMHLVGERYVPLDGFVTGSGRAAPRS